MAGKWAKLQGRVPDAPASDMTSAVVPGFLEKVEAKKALLSTLSFVQLQEAMLSSNEEWDELHAQDKELNVTFEALGQLLKKHFEAQGVSSVKGVRDKTFYTHVEPLVGVKEGRRPEAEAWVEKDPSRDYLWRLNPQSLASWVKDRLLQLDDEVAEEDKIPEFFNVQRKVSIRVR